MLSAIDVLEILDALQAVGVRAWLDGGWGVDALLRTQTRPHDDLDLVADTRDLPRLQAALANRGFALAVDELPTRCVLRDARDRRVDVHPVVFDDEGGGVQALPGGSSFRYPPAGFAGVGFVGGRLVPCLDAATQLLCHAGYPPDEADRHDVRALCARFGLEPPDGYR
jgi:lincosamide nucleotidyltransferase A/C/D/E